VVRGDHKIVLQAIETLSPTEQQYNVPTKYGDIVPTDLKCTIDVPTTDQKLEVTRGAEKVPIKFRAQTGE
jgi:hypothetical protein